MTTCDYCRKKASNVIYACPDHVKVLDKASSRRKDHSVKDIENLKKTKQKLVERINELTKERKEK